MSAVVLILAPGSNAKRSISRSGDLFDTAFVDAVRTLDGRGADLTVLVPWTADLAALIAVATLDTAPSFDPEREAGSGEARSWLVPYVPPGEAAREMENIFWRSSYLSLGGRPPPGSLKQTLGKVSAIQIVILGAPRRADAVRKVLRSRELKVLTFGSLLGPLEAARVVGVEPSHVIDLEERLPSSGEDEDLGRFPELATERSPEDNLERYIPFGLLLQHHFDALLPDDDEKRF